MAALTTIRTLKTRMSEFSTGKLRGFCLSIDSTYSDKDLLDIVALGANVVRFPIHLYRSGEQYNAPTGDYQLMLTRCAAIGLRVILVFVPIPAGPSSEWWENPELQQDIVSKWVSIASIAKNYPALQGYDIINEPVGAPVNNATDRARKTWWLSIAQVISTAIRTVDTKTPILIEPCSWGLPDQFWQTVPVKVTGLVASFHWYEPRAYTHQGILSSVVVPLPTSGYFSVLLEAEKFCAKFNVPMFVGEFSAVRWAPSREIWLRDAIAFFKLKNWGWTYHCWRAWEGWDAEILGDKPMGTVTSFDRTNTSPALIELMKGFLV